MVINQIHAIGDLIFLEPMYRHFWNRDGVKPIVPVRDHLIWLAQYIESADFRPLSFMTGIDLESLNVTEEYLPVRWANQIVRGYDRNDHHDFENMMLDKYALAGMKETDWTDIRLKFNEAKAEKLFQYLKPSRPYAVINTHCQAGQIASPKTDPHLQRIYMHQVPGFTLIDWYKVLADAEEFHSVSTSTFFLLEAMVRLPKKIVIYPRPNEDGLRGISKLKPTFKYDRGN